MKYKRANILLEVLLVCAILVTLIPLYNKVVLVSLHENKRMSVQMEVDRQLDFTQDYLQSVCDDAISVSVTGPALNIVTSKDVFDVGLKKQAIYVRRDAYRYLTTDPVIVTQLQFCPQNSKLCLVRLTANGKPYSFPLGL